MARRKRKERRLVSDGAGATQRRDCDCEACRNGMAAVAAKESDCMDRQGWFAHIVSDDHDSPTGFNYHTHGLPETYSHLDIQIVLPLPADVAHALGHTLVARVENGERFQVGTPVTGVLEPYSVVFVLAEECGRPVMRLIIPEPGGALFQPEMSIGLFRLQWSGCDQFGVDDRTGVGGVK